MDSFTSLVRTPIPPLLRRWGWCSWDAHGVGVQRRHLEAMRHLEMMRYLRETQVFFSVGGVECSYLEDGLQYIHR